MIPSAAPWVILCAEDDPDDQILTRDAFLESGFAIDVRFVEHGEELMDYLLGQGKYGAPGAAPTPGLIVVDLNMPLMNGREAIKAIRADAALRRAPIAVLTTSRSREDIDEAYDLGANSYLVKPVSIEGMAHLLGDLARYWFKTVELPRSART
jgi:CheY-like chemotaxis protein